MVPSFETREDGLKEQFEPEIKGFLFDQLSENYCKKKYLDFLIGIALPFTPSDYVKFQNGEGLSIANLAENIVICLGADPKFCYTKAYKRFLAKTFDERLILVVKGKAIEALSLHSYKKACLYARAALVLDSGDRDCLYTYACCCREWYLSLEGEDDTALISLLKDEANLYFEYTSFVDPEFAPSWYYLGFSYLNQGLYAKAQLVWQKFLDLKGNADEEEVKEIRERLLELKDPVAIETGVNAVLAGKMQEGLKILEPFTESSYAKWWPLHYYLAIAYQTLGYLEEAIEGFLNVIALAPSNYESTIALARLYYQLGEDALGEKYARKADLLAQNEKESV